MVREEAIFRKALRSRSTDREDYANYGKILLRVSIIHTFSEESCTSLWMTHKGQQSFTPLTPSQRDSNFVVVHSQLLLRMTKDVIAEITGTFLITSGNW